VGYSVKQDAPDDYLLGLAADHPIGDRLLLQGDAYYMNPLGADEASVNATDADGAPRLLFGVLGRI